jgi:hypothetical protein
MFRRPTAFATKSDSILESRASICRAQHTQQSHWASADDKTAEYIIDMERKWAEDVCVDNGVVASLLADDFQGTRQRKGRTSLKADELKDEKSVCTAHDCGLDEAKKCISSETVSPLSMAASMLSAKTSPSRAQRCAKFGPIRG